MDPRHRHTAARTHGPPPFRSHTCTSSWNGRQHEPEPCRLPLHGRSPTRSPRTRTRAPHAHSGRTPRQGKVSSSGMQRAMPECVGRNGVRCTRARSGVGPVPDRFVYSRVGSGCPMPCHARGSSKMLPPPPPCKIIPTWIRCPVQRSDPRPFLGRFFPQLINVGALIIHECESSASNHRLVSAPLPKDRSVVARWTVTQRLPPADQQHLAPGPFCCFIALNEITKTSQTHSTRQMRRCVGAEGRPCPTIICFPASARGSREGASVLLLGGAAGRGR